MRIKDIKKQISDIRVRAGYYLLTVIFVTGLLMINACNGGSGSSGDTPPAVINNGDPVQGDEDDETDDEGDSASTVYTWDPSEFTHVYDVGPGKTYTEPGDVPWESLTPSTLVRIYYRNTHPIRQSG